MTAAPHLPIVPADSAAEIVVLQRFVNSRIRSGSLSPSHNPHPAEVPSIELEDVTVRVGATVRDPTFMGTFDRTAGVRWIQVNLYAVSNAPSGTGATAHRPATDLPYPEQIVWLRTVLGDLADYAYKVVTDRGLLRPGPAMFTVLVDRHGHGQLAPSDFDWAMAGGSGRRIYPEKVVPEDPALLKYLRLHGDTVDADSILHPQIVPPPVWAQQFLSEMTATIADHIGRLDEGRLFTFHKVALHSMDRVIVRYTWHLLDGGREYGYDIDLNGLRAHRLRDLDDPRAFSAGRSIGGIPFGQPVFHSPRFVDGVIWIDIGTPSRSPTDGAGESA